MSTNICTSAVRQWDSIVNRGAPIVDILATDMLYHRIDDRYG